MTPTIALATAGPTAVLVTRPAGVPHVYVGPLTPSGRSAPRGRRTVCRAHITGRLSVVPRDAQPGSVCRRCSACLCLPRRQAEPTRLQLATRCAHLTVDDITAALVDATSPAELAHVAHLALVSVGLVACLDTLIAPYDGGPYSTPHPISAHIGYHRRRVAGFPERPETARLEDIRLSAAAARRADSQMRRTDRENRIAALGFNNAVRPR